MNKIILSLAALAALSTASFAAGNRSYDLRDTEYYNAAAASQVNSGTVDVAPMSADSSSSPWLEERRLDEKNDTSSK